MASEHKGDLVFEYWTSNPWACQATDRGLLAPGEGSQVPVGAQSAVQLISSTPSRSTASTLVAAYVDDHLVPSRAARTTPTTSTAAVECGASSTFAATSSCCKEKEAVNFPVEPKIARGLRKPRWRRKERKVFGEYLQEDSSPKAF